MNPTFSSLDARLSTAVRDLDPAGMQARRPARSPRRGRWSIQQIVEHLILTYTATEGVLAGRIAKNKPTQATPTLPQHCARFMVLTLRHFPRGVSAPLPVMPPEHPVPMSGEQMVSRFTERLSEMDRRMEEASACFGDRRRSVSHMILGPLSPPEWRRFHLIHSLHHLRQIERIRREHTH